jgi:hypothetical protein
MFEFTAEGVQHATLGIVIFVSCVYATGLIALEIKYGRKDMRDGREGSLGEAMEKAEVEVTESMAKTCRQPGDYALWGLVGREAVGATKGMTLDQRSVFVALVAEGIENARQRAREGGGRLQHALEFKPGRQYEN